MQGILNRMVFNGRAYDILNVISMNSRPKNSVVGFCSTGSKNNFTRCAVHELGNFLSG